VLLFLKQIITNTANPNKSVSIYMLYTSDIILYITGTPHSMQVLTCTTTGNLKLNFKSTLNESREFHTSKAVVFLDDLQ
jgi:hypothetical protein